LLEHASFDRAQGRQLTPTRSGAPRTGPTSTHPNSGDAGPTSSASTRKPSKTPTPHVTMLRLPSLSNTAAPPPAARPPSNTSGRQSVEYTFYLGVQRFRRDDGVQSRRASALCLLPAPDPCRAPRRSWHSVQCRAASNQVMNAWDWIRIRC
jgi:hypothetical protein